MTDYRPQTTGHRPQNERAPFVIRTLMNDVIEIDEGVRLVIITNS